MRSIRGDIIWRTSFTFPWRLLLSGSSGSGKTRFGLDLLKSQHLFEDAVSSVIYYHPSYLNECPVDWHCELDIPVSYRVGLPTKEELMSLQPKTCVVLDDLYDEAVKSSHIDHLFRVISGKMNICVMIMTQNNFSSGKHNRDIRNSCNFSALFRNGCDSNINKRICQMAGLQRAYAAAQKSQEDLNYPYLFIDQSQQGHLSPYRLYANIFDKYQIVFHAQTGMKGYVITENDFKQFYKVTKEKKQTFEARKRENEIKSNNTQAISREESSSEESESEEYSNSDSSNSNDSRSSYNDNKGRHRKSARRFVYKYKKRPKF